METEKIVVKVKKPYPGLGMMVPGITLESSDGKLINTPVTWEEAESMSKEELHEKLQACLPENYILED